MQLSEVQSFARAQLTLAQGFSREIKFEKRTAQRKSLVLENAQAIRAKVHIGDDPEFAELDIGDGIGAWTSIAAVDLRGSTRLADTLDPRDMYLLAHTLLPTLAHVCQKSGGMVMNFRGDGLFASFGLERYRSTDEKTKPDQEEIESANRKAGFAA